MIILGFSHLEPSPFGHDSTVAILEDGIIKCAISEERFSRIKHDGGYPSMAIQCCLNEIGIRFDDIDKIAVGFGVEEKIMKRECQKNSSYVSYDSKFKKTHIEEKNPIFYNHQYIHARTAFSLSEFRRGLIVSLDGGGIDNGKSNSGGIFVVNNAEIEPLVIYPSEASLGFVYGSLTDACGFRMQDGEGKTMSLAAYGEKESPDIKDKVYRYVESFFPKFSGIEYKEGGISGLIGKFQTNVQLLTNIDPRIQELKNNYKNTLIAWAAQKILEEKVIELLTNAIEYTGEKEIMVTGGIFMNMIMNMKIKETFDKKCKIFFNPICGDVGNAIGAALECYHEETGYLRKFPDMSLYLGSSHDDAEIENAARKLNVKIQKVNKVDTAIDFITREKVIGWFQDRAELGARALGNRSILSLATNEKFKNIVNEKVKKREAWRPFCPTIIEENSNKFLINCTDAPYMILGCHMHNPIDFKAVSHIDGTCRPQILKREINPNFYDLSKGCGGIVLNTSFNLAGEPIVENPTNAIMTLKHSQLDAIIVNDYLITNN